MHRFNLNRRLKLQANQRLERCVIEASDHLFIMQSQRLFFESIAPSDSAEKLEYLEHPLLIENPSSNVAARKGKIVFTYAGGLFAVCGALEVVSQF